MSKLNSDDRRELYELYIKLQECAYNIKNIIRHTKDWKTAKAYWYGSLSEAIKHEEYVGHNPTMQSFLISQGIIDENENEDETA
jgi:hypothetical protein